MKTVLYNKEEQRVPIKIWADLADVEVSAVQQLKNISQLPFVFKHVAAMPDVHLGKGATVGSVIATKGAVIPSAVGVDIGCGMMAVKLGLGVDILRDRVSIIRSSIERSIPVGHNSNKEMSKSAEEWAGWKTWIGTGDYTRAGLQLGSLGGGNHFIELCEDTEGSAWVMLHSGSRNIGKVTADRHITEAKGLMKKMMIELPDPELAYFAEKTPEYDRYIRDLMWCQDYAAMNREEMMSRVLKDISHAVGFNGAPIATNMIVNCHHNYASRENHYGENVLVTRKGAVRARMGDLGIIPGSMGTRSYIVRGLGNIESFNSCSHGAGRKMSRTAARSRFNLQDLADQTIGVDCRKDEGVLDEIPGAYKNIDDVMNNQKDLVEVVAQIKQFMCIKG